ncbi:hypothetical protein E2C01_055377 [Portunus trituberculatus]|uniref:Uncharacterized protein n=1 Tax=Portunus trituberculatus TaxID=210409 RepID=A0A5B7GWM7_PORTR|nr:hypothetical protein [Portunus trituberculatus]
MCCKCCGSTEGSTVRRVANSIIQLYSSMYGTLLLYWEAQATAFHLIASSPLTVFSSSPPQCYLHPSLAILRRDARLTVPASCLPFPPGDSLYIFFPTFSSLIFLSSTPVPMLINSRVLDLSLFSSFL